MPKGFHYRQAISFVARRIEAEGGATVERREGRVVDIGENFERASHAGIAAQIPHQVADHPALPAGEHQLESRALRNACCNEFDPNIVDQAVPLAGLDGADQESITPRLYALR